MKIQLPFLILFIIISLFLLVKANNLIYPDLLFTYPYITDDGFQWVHDSLLYLGYNGDYIYRNPALPFIIAVLSILNIENNLPMFNVFLLLVYNIFIYFNLRGKFSSKVIFLTIIFFFLNFSIQSFFDYILADQWAITFLFISFYFLFKSKRNVNLLVPTFIFYSISFQFQYASAFILPAYLFYLYNEVYYNLSNKKKFWKVMIFVTIICSLIVLPNLIYKFIKFGNPLFSGVTHFPLLKFHFFGLLYYAVNFFAFFGIPVALVIIHGFIKSLKLNRYWMFINIGTFCYFGFWILFYLWLDVRFLLYFIPFFPFYFALSLSHLRIEKYFSIRNTNWIQKIVIGFVFLFSISLSFYNKQNPFSSNILPITPQKEIVFGNENITEFIGNVNININQTTIQDHEYSFPSVNSMRSYKKAYSAASATIKFSEYNELKVIYNRILKDHKNEFIFSDCTPESSNYYENMKRKYILRIKLVACGNDSNFVLSRKSNDPNAIFRGNHFSVNKK